MERFLLTKQTSSHILMQWENKLSCYKIVSLCVSYLDFKAQKWYNNGIQEYAITYDIKGEYFMATIRKRGNSYQIRVSCGYDTSGNQVVQTMTWKPDEGMSKKQIEKELNRQAVMFEESVYRQDNRKALAGIRELSCQRGCERKDRQAPRAENDTSQPEFYLRRVQLRCSYGLGIGQPVQESHYPKRRGQGEAYLLSGGDRTASHGDKQ